MVAGKIRCFFDTEVDGVPLGRIIFELFNEICPKTCENFRTLCTGEKGIGKTTEKPLHYKNVKFHRVIKDFMVQAGDFSAGNGTGGESIYGGQFEDENFDLKHDVPFLLSMANRGVDTNGSQFFITTQPASHLDGKHVVFGRVVSGQEIVVAIENLPVDNRSRPLQQAVISNCGELIMQRSTQLKSKEKKKKKKKIDGSDSEADKKIKKKKKDKKHKHKRDKLSEGELEDDDDVSTLEVMSKGQEPDAFNNHYKPHPLASISAINPEEIPEVPKNRFLDRGYQNKTDDNAKDVGQVPGRLKSKAADVQFYTRSGRKVKGRGSLRYRTPSRSRSRSVTPPHWRQAQRRTIPLERYQRQTEQQMKREYEIDERRKKREERHRILSEGDLQENDEEDFWRSGNSGGMRSVISGGDSYKLQRSFDTRNRAEDKTMKDWRIGRMETSLENKENFSRKSNEDLRQKIKNKMANAHSSMKDSSESKTFMSKDYENVDLDDTALDYEAENDDDEDSELDHKSMEAEREVTVKSKISKPKLSEKPKEQGSTSKSRIVERGAKRFDRRGRSRSRDKRSKGEHSRSERKRDHHRSNDKDSHGTSDKYGDRKDRPRKREHSAEKRREVSSLKKSKKRESSSGSSSD